MPRIAPKFNRCFKNTYLLEELKVDVFIKEIVHWLHGTWPLTNCPHHLAIWYPSELGFFCKIFLDPVCRILASNEFTKGNQKSLGNQKAGENFAAQIQMETHINSKPTLQKSCYFCHELSYTLDSKTQTIYNRSR